MLKEHEIPLAWVELTFHQPDCTEEHTDGTRHDLKQIPAYANRWLRLIINMADGNPVCVTLFFDRRLRKKS